MEGLKVFRVLYDLLVVWVGSGQRADQKRVTQGGKLVKIVIMIT